MENFFKVRYNAAILFLIIMAALIFVVAGCQEREDAQGKDPVAHVDPIPSESCISCHTSADIINTLAVTDDGDDGHGGEGG